MLRRLRQPISAVCLLALVGQTFGCDALSDSGAKEDSAAYHRHDAKSEKRVEYAPSPMQVDDARRMPPPSGEDYAKIVENDFLAVADAPLSTFSIDVDTASYANTRRFLRDGSLPPTDAVRIEEFVNYFDYNYPTPSGEFPFSVVAEVGDCPWAENHQLVHIGVQGQDIAADEIPARNLVFLLDVSGSMNNADKLPLLKQAMRMLVAQLDENDRVSIVVYAGSSGVVLEPTPGNQENRILEAMDRLRAGGSTNGGEGIRLAYALARQNFVEGGINRVMLATDGDFNVGTTSHDELTSLIEKERESGVFLTVLGFGTGNLKDSTMENLADKGNGNYAYIDSIREARKVLVKEAGSTLVTIAKDVKIQVEFNPEQIASYRLIGYENRLLEDKDFNDDTKDAGEIGAGHTVTALYEVVPKGAELVTPKVDALRYQKKPEPATTPKAQGDELMHVKLRYKAPQGSTSEKVSFPVHARDNTVAETTNNFRFSAAVAGFGMLLRDSKHKGTLTFADVRRLANGATGADRQGNRAEFLELVDVAARLKKSS